MDVSYIKEKAFALAGEMTALRQHLHAHPEISWQEVETTRLIVSKLSEIGFKDIKVGVDGKPVAYLRSPGFAHPTKNYWGFTTQGRFIEVDDVRAWSAEVDPNWNQRRGELFGTQR